jgi:hypothetical protein
VKNFVWGFVAGCVWMVGSAFAVAVAMAAKDE